MVSNSRVKYLTPKLLTLGVLSMLVLSACQQNLSPVAGRFTSEQGVNIEAAWPADVFMLAKLGTRDAGQISAIKDLNAQFPNDPMGMLAKDFNAGFRQGADLEKAGIDYEKDVLPILNEKTEVYFAIYPGEGGNLEKIRGVMAMTLADQGKLDALLNKQVEKGIFVREVYNTWSYFSAKPEQGTDTTLYLVRVKDTLFAFTDLPGMKSALDSLAANNVALYGNKVYQKAISSYKPSMAFIYGDFSKVVDFMKKAGPEGAEMVKVLDASGVQDSGIQSIESELILASAEKDGIRLTATVLGREGQDLTKTAGEISKSYLVSQIPARYPVIYSEAYNLKQAYEMFIKTAQSDPEMASGIKEMETFLTEQGLDLEKDIMSFLGKGYAFVVEDTDSVIPALGLYVDVSGNEQGALKVAGKINEAVDKVWGQAKEESPELAFVLFKDEVVKGRLWKFKLNVDTLLTGAPAEVIKKLSGQKLEFYYGVLPQKVMVFALKPDLEKVYGQSPVVSESDEFKKARSYLNGADRGVTYLAPSQVFVYLDRVIKLAQEANGGQMPADLQEYQTVRSYVWPIKSFMAASKVVEKDKVVAEAFLHIGQ